MKLNLGDIIDSFNGCGITCDNEMDYHSQLKELLIIKNLTNETFEQRLEICDSSKFDDIFSNQEPEYNEMPYANSDLESDDENSDQTEYDSSDVSGDFSLDNTDTSNNSTTVTGTVILLRLNCRELNSKNHVSDFNFFSSIF